MQKVLVLDNYDSFTYMLNDYLLSAGMETVVLRNDFSRWESIRSQDWKGIVISPGPGTPDQAGTTLQLIAHFHAKVPMLGVCLGHQALGQFFGAKVVPALKPMHGFTSQVSVSRHPMWNGIPEHLRVMRYHSLVLENIPGSLEVTALTPEKEVMGIAHSRFPCWGIQFHPESALTEYGHQLIRNWKSFFGL